MKTPLKTLLLAAGVAVASQAAYAQSSSDDLILGFNEQGVASFDYIVDLGTASSILGGANLSGAINMSTFTSTFTSPSGVAVGVVGGDNTASPVRDLYATTAHGASAPTTISGSQLSSAAAFPPGITLGQVSSGDGASWSTLVAPSSTDNGSGTFASGINFNPMNAISGSSIVEDLWRNTRLTPTGAATGWVDEGSFTLTFIDANTATLTFAPVPEPSSIFGLCAGAGLLLLARRRKTA